VNRADLTRRWREAKVIAEALAGRKAPWPGFGEPFNGQAVRLGTVRGLIAEFSPDAFIETGTFLGFTTRFFAGNGVPVHTIEVDPRFYVAARVRLTFNPDVRVVRGNSRDALAELARTASFARPFAYLDAHWWDDLPLTDEVRTIFGRWADALIVIDDMRVPDDHGYGFDEHHGVPLALELLDLPDGAVAAHPAVPAADESGARRGTLYLGQGASGVAAIDALVERRLLRRVGVSATALAV
jgi:hypothetical protein